MPRKKKRPSEMNDAELLRQVFPEGVSKAIEAAAGKRPEPDTPDKNKDTEE